MPQPGSLQNVWGFKFRWTALHQDLEQYHQLQSTYDKLGEDSVEVLTTRFNTDPATKLDLYKLLEAHHAEDGTLSHLWNDVTMVPSWVDWDQIARGQEVLYRYGAAVVTGLAYQSLIGGTGASNNISETLSRTGGFSQATARKRLLETTQFVLQITESLPSIQPGGAGFAAALRVRILHAQVRRRIIQLSAARPTYFSTEKHGIPINDADCIGTIMAFSSILIWQSLPRQGIYLRQQEIRDYLALWRLVAVYMGTPSECLASVEQAKATMESILLHGYNPSEKSKKLAQNMIRALENRAPIYPSRALIEANIWWLNGCELASAIGINQPSLYYRALLGGQTMLFALASYINRDIAVLDRWQIRTFRRELWAIVTEAKGSQHGQLSVFDFKYVPGFKLLAPEGVHCEEKLEVVFWTADRKASAMVLGVLGLFPFCVLSLLFINFSRSWSV